MPLLQLPALFVTDLSKAEEDFSVRPPRVFGTTLTRLASEDLGLGKPHVVFEYTSLAGGVGYLRDAFMLG
jgi:hypothetical protein